MTCCSTRLMTASLPPPAIAEQGLLSWLGRPSSIQSSHETVQDAGQICQEILAVVLVQIDHLKASALQFQQRPQITEPKAGGAIFVLNDDGGHSRSRSRAKNCGRESFTPEAISLTTAAS